MIRVDLYPDQLSAVDKLRTGSILCGGTGSGKSITSLAYFFMNVCQGTLVLNGSGEVSDMAEPRDLYIITTAKKRDKGEWLEECSKYLLTTNPENSFCGVKVTVDSWNNIKKYVDVKDAFFIFDEQRVIGSGAWVKSFYKITKKNDWVLLSATPGDTWSDYIPVFVANGYYKNKTDFLTQHAVYSRYERYNRPTRYVGTAKLERLRKSVLVPLPYHKHTKRHYHNVIVDYDLEAVKDLNRNRWNYDKGAPILNVSEYMSCLRKTVNSHPSRLESLNGILDKHDKVIVFYNYDFELEALRSLRDRDDIAVAEYNGHKHEEIPSTDRWVYLVQYTSGAEGWNCIETDTMVFYSLNYSHRVMEQSAGRIDRRNTEFVDLHYYRLRSKSRLDSAIMNCLQRKKDFSEKAFVTQSRGRFE